jgi:superfamily II DNA or RNA helicase
MSLTPPPTPTLTSIIDNQGDNTLHNALELITESGRELWIATAFFSLDALNMIGENLLKADRILLLFGDDASPKHRNALIRAMQERSDKDLLKQREKDPILGGLHHAKQLIEEGRLEARVYTKQKFHAKAYLSHHHGFPPMSGIIGSGNFTRSGLTQNIELNLHLTLDQVDKLRAWYEERWAEAEQDEITEILKNEIERHIKLYDPYSIYLRALITWGDWVQGRDPLPESKILPMLDPHQEDGFRQALNIIEREGGAMICDGVGLGKSYIALALIEHSLRNGESVLLLAPRAILDASWSYYLHDYLRRYTRGFNNLKALPITWFGFEPEPTEEERQRAEAKGQPLPELSQADKDKLEDLDVWAEQAQLVVIDESHNFRRTDANRYINLLRMLQPKLLGRKKVVLLTATPLNTDYQDVTAQFRLVTLEGGAVGGIPLRELQAQAASADRETRKDPEKQPTLFEGEVDLLNAALHKIAIQRSRSTCKLLAQKRNQVLRFPVREDLAQISYKLSPLYVSLVDKTRHDFEELAKFIAAYREEVKRAAGSANKKLRKGALQLPREGLRFSAYLPDRYRRDESESLRDAQVESFLVSLVFINVMKQLESSIAAFEGILRALGAGLCARLHYVFGDDVGEVLADHLEWIRGPIKHLDSDDELFEYDPAGLTEQDEEYLTKVQDTLKVHRSLAGFGHDTHDTKSWRMHIESDLKKLREIHDRTVMARDQGEDCKLSDVAAQIASQRAEGRKVLVFTQSVRTADYLYHELPNYMPDERIERITAAVQGDRRRLLLHAFSPRYNPVEEPPLEFQELGVLVCTDVLSEGVNLQEAGCILNYDLHWNPVRLIQRIGRVDRRLKEDDPGHSFSILNVVPPKQIEEIINLVGTVEGRKRKILKLLGLDQSFFSADDEEGTLQEFNSMVEGSTSPRDYALSEYNDVITNKLADVDRSGAAPPGAFGVWEDAPVDGFFGLFRVTLREDAAKVDQEAFAPLVGSPILVMQGDVGSMDAPEILDILSKTVQKEPSGKPSAPDVLVDRLAALRKTAVTCIPNRTAGVTAQLVCWMELRRA